MKGRLCRPSSAPSPKCKVGHKWASPLVLFGQILDLRLKKKKRANVEFQYISPIHLKY